MKKILKKLDKKSSFYLIKSIEFYQKYISPLHKASCVFYPTCSHYTKEAIDKYGFLKGCCLGFYRILRCHPWQSKHIDPVP